MHCRYMFALLLTLPLALSAQTHEGKIEAAHAATASSTHEPAVNVVYVLLPRATDTSIYVDDEAQIDPAMMHAGDAGNESARQRMHSLRFNPSDPNIHVCHGRQCRVYSGG